MLPTVVFFLCQACGSDTSDGPDGGDGVANEGQCSGSAVSPIGMADSGSCIIQGGDWLSATASCSGTPRACDGLVLRELCLDTWGCSWKEADGSMEGNPYAGGTCGGEQVACGTILNMEDCLAMSPCVVESTMNAAEVEVPRCFNRGGTQYLNTTDCNGIADQLSVRALHPEIAHTNCVTRFGCEWTNADGSVEPAFGGQPLRATRACSHPAGSFQMARALVHGSPAACPASQEIVTLAVDELFTGCITGCECSTQSDTQTCSVEQWTAACSDIIVLREQIRLEDGELRFDEFIIDTNADVTCGYLVRVVPM
ncbi:MAG: hypothetical protein JNL21_00125 [Myxococcales bacterium]|nr:hypothetical protein [Myxococcales bacterium]